MRKSAGFTPNSSALVQGNAPTFGQPLSEPEGPISHPPDSVHRDAPSASKQPQPSSNVNPAWSSTSYNNNNQWQGQWPSASSGAFHKPRSSIQQPGWTAAEASSYPTMQPSAGSSSYYDNNSYYAGYGGYPAATNYTTPPYGPGHQGYQQRAFDGAPPYNGHQNPSSGPPKLVPAYGKQGPFGGGPMLRPHEMKREMGECREMENENFTSLFTQSLTSLYSQDPDNAFAEGGGKQCDADIMILEPPASTSQSINTSYQRPVPPAPYAGSNTPAYTSLSNQQSAPYFYENRNPEPSNNTVVQELGVVKNDDYRYDRPSFDDLDMYSTPNAKTTTKKRKSPHAAPESATQENRKKASRAAPKSDSQWTPNSFSFSDIQVKQEPSDEYPIVDMDSNSHSKLSSKESSLGSSGNGDSTTKAPHPAHPPRKKGPGTTCFDRFEKKSTPLNKKVSPLSVYAKVQDSVVLSVKCRRYKKRTKPLNVKEEPQYPTPNDIEMWKSEGLYDQSYDTCVRLVMEELVDRVSHIEEPPVFNTPDLTQFHENRLRDLLYHFCQRHSLDFGEFEDVQQVLQPNIVTEETAKNWHRASATNRRTSPPACVPGKKERGEEKKSVKSPRAKRVLRTLPGRVTRQGSARVDPVVTRRYSTRSANIVELDVVEFIESEGEAGNLAEVPKKRRNATIKQPAGPAKEKRVEKVSRNTKRAKKISDASADKEMEIAKKSPSSANAKANCDTKTKSKIPQKNAIATRSSEMKTRTSFACVKIKEEPISDVEEVAVVLKPQEKKLSKVTSRKVTKAKTIVEHKPGTRASKVSQSKTPVKSISNEKPEAVKSKKLPAATASIKSSEKEVPLAKIENEKVNSKPIESINAVSNKAVPKSKKARLLQNHLETLKSIEVVKEMTCEKAPQTCDKGGKKIRTLPLKKMPRRISRHEPQVILQKLPDAKVIHREDPAVDVDSDSDKPPKLVCMKETQPERKPFVRSKNNLENISMNKEGDMPRDYSKQTLAKVGRSGKNRHSIASDDSEKPLVIDLDRSSSVGEDVSPYDSPELRDGKKTTSNFNEPFANRKCVRRASHLPQRGEKEGEELENEPPKLSIESFGTTKMERDEVPDNEEGTDRPILRRLLQDEEGSSSQDLTNFSNVGHSEKTEANVRSDNNMAPHKSLLLFPQNHKEVDKMSFIPNEKTTESDLKHSDARYLNPKFKGLMKEIEDIKQQANQKLVEHTALVYLQERKEMEAAQYLRRSHATDLSVKHSTSDLNQEPSNSLEDICARDLPPYSELCREAYQTICTESGDGQNNIPKITAVAEMIANVVEKVCKKLARRKSHKASSTHMPPSGPRQRAAHSQHYSSRYHPYMEAKCSSQTLLKKALQQQIPPFASPFLKPESLSTGSSPSPSYPVDRILHNGVKSDPGTDSSSETTSTSPPTNHPQPFKQHHQQHPHRKYPHPKRRSSQSGWKEASHTVPHPEESPRHPREREPHNSQRSSTHSNARPAEEQAFLIAPPPTPLCLTTSGGGSEGPQSISLLEGSHKATVERVYSSHADRGHAPVSSFMPVTFGDPSSNPPADSVNCRGCGLPNAKFICSGCRKHWYCSAECQSMRWPDHSKDCDRGFY